MGYKKGQILTFDYPEKEGSGIIHGYHRVVVLHKRETPYDTILVAPITSAEGLKSQDNIPSNYVRILKGDYPFVLDYDSFINLDMTSAMDKDELQELQRYNKKINCTLNDFDLYQLDCKIMLTYELSKTFGLELNKRVTDEFENVIEYIDVDIKDKIKQVLSKIEDPQIIKGIVSILDDLIDQLRTAYINK